MCGTPGSQSLYLTTLLWWGRPYIGGSKEETCCRWKGYLRSNLTEGSAVVTQTGGTLAGKESGMKTEQVQALCLWIRPAFLKSPAWWRPGGFEKPLIPRDWLPLVAAAAHYWIIWDEAEPVRVQVGIWLHIRITGKLLKHTYAPGQWNKNIWGYLDLPCPT